LLDHQKRNNYIGNSCTMIQKFWYCRN